MTGGKTTLTTKETQIDDYRRTIVCVCDSTVVVDGLYLAGRLLARHWLIVVSLRRCDADQTTKNDRPTKSLFHRRRERLGLSKMKERTRERDKREGLFMTPTGVSNQTGGLVNVEPGPGPSVQSCWRLEIHWRILSVSMLSD